MNPINPQSPISVATQTDNRIPTSNVGQGRSPIDESKHSLLFEFENEHPPDYRRRNFLQRPHSRIKICKPSSNS